MDDFSVLRDEIQKFKKIHPQTRRYPKTFWKKVVALAPKHSPETIAQELGIGANNIRRRFGPEFPRKAPPAFVPLRLPRELPEPKGQTLEISLPGGIQIKIYQ